MSHILFFLVIAIILSILIGRVAYRANNLLGFLAFVSVFLGVFGYGVFGYAG